MSDAVVIEIVHAHGSRRPRAMYVDGVRVWGAKPYASENLSSELFDVDIRALERALALAKATEPSHDR